MKCFQRLWPTLPMFQTWCFGSDWNFIYNNNFLLWFLSDPRNSNITFSSLGDLFWLYFICSGCPNHLIVIILNTSHCASLSLYLVTVDYMCGFSEINWAVRSYNDLWLLLSIKPSSELFLVVGRWLSIYYIINLGELRLGSCTLLLRFLLAAVNILTIIDPM